MKKKIAIQTLFLHDNYGGILQAFALQNYLENLGFDVIHLNRHNKPDTLLKVKLFLHKIRYAAFYKMSNLNKNTFKGFISKNIKLSPDLNSFSEWQKYITEQNFAAVIVGSDQVWRFEYVHHLIKEFFLDFEKEVTKKLSYAASFGVENIDVENLKNVEDLLSNFDAVSVREIQSINKLKEIGIGADHHLDPTFLLKKEHYIELFDLNEDLNNEEIFCYVLDKNPFKQQVIDKVAKMVDLNYTTVFGDTPNLDNYLDADIIFKPKPEEWLQKFLAAKYIITDSFHGMVFSIIFNKKFLVIGNEERGLSRFTSLLRQINLMDRLILVGKNLPDCTVIEDEIDYDVINNFIEAERDRSNAYFKKHLS